MKQNSQIRAGAFFVALLFAVLSGCGPKGGDGSIDSTPGVYPSNGHVIHSDWAFRITLEASARKHPGSTYSFTLYGDKEKNETLASVSGVREQGDGSIFWVPGKEFIIEPNRQYWWEWVDSSGGKSGLLYFFAASYQGGKPISPRNGGVMDRNIRNNPTLGVSHIYSGPGLAPTYDFQLFADSGATNMLSEGKNVEQAANENHTRWSPGVSLNEGAVYYWRVRVNAPGVSSDWSRLNSFTVVDVCSINGPPYAAFAIDWTPKKCANHLTPSLRNMNEALGPPNGVSKPEYSGFLSLDYGGELIVEMGATIVDHPGGDFHVYEFVSTEILEAFIGPTEAGPWTSLGVGWCGLYCEFDLALVGASYARYVRIVDRGTEALYCHETSGSDIDSVTWAKPAASPDACYYPWW
ncbi:MAG: hypothetical protein OEZ32_10825 [Nitrospinota bacterium]|nr:hypothetical protein [Nitrospinota bacterium]